MIDHVLNVTGQDSLQYVGFSMGTTGFMVMMNEKPEYAEKVKMAHLLAPVAYVQYLRTPLVVIKPISKLIEVLMLTCNGKLCQGSFHEFAEVPRGDWI